MVVTATLEEPLQVALLRLKEVGRKLAVVALGEGPPPTLEGTGVLRLPPPPPRFFSPAPQPALQMEAG